jgi:HAD superfamily hydrolase (TIGR01458 family)
MGGAREVTSEASVRCDHIRGVLLDVDGTLLDGERAVPGAAGALRRLRHRGIPFRLTTNTTRRPRSAIAAALREAGIDVAREEVVVPASLARLRILGSGRTRALLLVPDASLEDFEGVVPDEDRPDWVVMGDMGRAFTFERLNDAFRRVREGARLLALHKNRFWYAGERDGLVLDAGAFVAAVEFASGAAAEVVGKPSRAFFDLALEDLGVPPAQVLVVGDDAETDVAGGAAAGCRTALVRTGKGASGAIPAGARPDLVLGSVADLLA